MAKKVVITPESNAVAFYRVQQYDKGTTLCAPSDYFGVVCQNYHKLKLFTDSVKLDKKVLPDIKVPFLGKIKDIITYFFAYGFTTKFEERDRPIKLKSGRKAKMTFKCSYSVEVENANKVYDISCFPYLSKWKTNSDSGVLTFSQMKEILISELEKYIIETEAKNGEWKYIRGTGVQGRPMSLNYEAINVSTNLRINAKKFFEKIGYKVNDIELNFEYIGYDE